MHEINWILAHGVSCAATCVSEADVTFEEIQRDFDAVFIGVGAHKGMKLGIKGEDYGGGGRRR